MINIAINGFGRIGRLVLKAGINEKDINFVAINDLTDAKSLAQLLKYDSVHGKFPGSVEAGERCIIVNGKQIKIFSEKEPEKLPWKDLNIDIVVESSGHFRTNIGAFKHIKAGAKKVLISAPAKCEEKVCEIGEHSPDVEPVKTIVMGVNEHEYKGERLVSNGSCTTNCFALLAKVINDNYGIEGGVMNTIHAYTNDQSIIDAPHKDPRRAKAAALNIIPTSTGAAEVIGEVIPQLNGKITGSAVRVPVACGSVVIFVAELKKENITKEQVNWLFGEVSKYHLKGLLEYSDEPLVSSDIVGNPHSCIFDSQLTECVDNRMLTVVGWYDNEWGYSNRMVDLIKLMMKL